MGHIMNNLFIKLNNEQIIIVILGKCFFNHDLEL